MSVLQIDFETRSTVPLPKTGVYVYAENADTDIWLMAWAFDEEEPELWHPGEPLPERLVAHIRAGGEVRAWNASFERIVWREIMVKRYGAPELTLEQTHDTAAEAATMALPRGLDQASEVTGVEFLKDEKGSRLMKQMMKPRDTLPNGTHIWWDAPEKIARLGEYCKQDVRAERAIAKVVRRLTPLERIHYLETERANDRGIYLDRALVDAAQAVANEGIERANDAILFLTNGTVSAVTKTAQIKAWIKAESGLDVPSIAKAPLQELLTTDLPANVREVLEHRSDAGRASLSKLKSMVMCACDDGYIRGTELYHGASTGRLTGKLIQPHNFPKGEVKKIEEYIPLVMARDYEGLDMFYPPTIIILSMMRSMLVAPPGHDLIAGDYAAIEARVVNWLAGQEDVLAMFAAGDDVYSYNAGRLPGAKPYVQDVKHEWRQTGKFQELACGFGMGHKKAVSAAKTVYQLTITEAEAKLIVKNYRDTHKKVVQFWQEANDAAIAAVENPGSIVVFGGRKNLKFTVQGAYLYMILPSHRPLAYAAPRIEMTVAPWSRNALEEWKKEFQKIREIKNLPDAVYDEFMRELGPKPKEERIRSVVISAINPKTKKWDSQVMYGGIWVENATQALARDLMLEAVIRLGDVGYMKVLTVHDEIVTKVPEGFGSVEEFERLASESPEWATGLPVATEAWRGKRYKKG